jgi:putative flippase GtrA
MKCPKLSGWLAYATVGAVGFAVDGGILSLLSQTFAVNVYLARLFSFTAATIATWALNRSWVFKVDAVDNGKKRAEYGKYLFVQTGGAVVNLGIFSMLIRALPALHTTPIIPLAVGALFGLVFNFSGARYWVFKRKFR